MQEQTDNSSNLLADLKEKALTEPVASFLGTTLVELSYGYAKVKMMVNSEYVNFNGWIFGGIIMSLADQAFAYASNSVTTPNIASQFNIHFIAGAKVGDELTAECRVIKNGRRVCISEITVVNHEEKLIARATGTTIPVS